ncbi:MAG: DUF6338 family protein [Rhodobacteraceae bacterium]|nr:DUF6338 family protein [Paracoccaceae bacterium]
MFIDLLKPETFDFVAKFFLAGYIVIVIRSRFVVGERPKAAHVVAEAVILSLINQLIFQTISQIFIWIVPTEYSQWVWMRFPFYIEVVFLPLLWGLLIGANLSKGWKHAVFRRLSMPIVSPIQRAHDFAFGFNREPCLVIVTYEDETIVRGHFGTESLAASDPERSDLYLERLYTVDNTDQWIETMPGRSALLSLNNVRSIEFLDQITNDTNSEGKGNA